MTGNKSFLARMGIILTIVFFIVSTFLWIYQTFIFDIKPKLRFEIISNEGVLMLDKDLSELSIFYEDINLLKENKNISILILRIVNDGKNITQSLYDQRIPIGFKILGGELISKPVIINSSDSIYFSQIIKDVSYNTVEFNKLIIDKSDFIDLKCYILSNYDKKSSITTFGKISGMKNISVGTPEFKTNPFLSWRLTLLIYLCSMIFGVFLNWINDLIKNKKR